MRSSFCKKGLHILWCIFMGLGHNDPWVESHMWPQQMWSQRSSRGQWPLVQVFAKTVTVSTYFHVCSGETRGSRTTCSNSTFWSPILEFKPVHTYHKTDYDWSWWWLFAKCKLRISRNYLKKKSCRWPTNLYPQSAFIHEPPLVWSSNMRCTPTKQGTIYKGLFGDICNWSWQRGEKWLICGFLRFSYNYHLHVVSDLFSNIFPQKTNKQTNKQNKKTKQNKKKKRKKPAFSAAWQIKTVGIWNFEGRFLKITLPEITAWKVLFTQLVLSQIGGARVWTWFWYQIKAELCPLQRYQKLFAQNVTCSLFCGSATHIYPKWISITFQDKTQLQFEDKWENMRPTVLKLLCQENVSRSEWQDLFW